jgi:hypothetical protein
MLTFIYSTCRKNPKFEWFIDSLYNQVVECNFDSSKIQIVLVDFDLQYDSSRIEHFKSIINNRFELTHVECKPCAYQGKYKLTSINYHTCSTPRNTGICYAKYDYLFFIDDLCVLKPGSFKHMVDYAKQRIVVNFSYKKVYDLSVENGKIKTIRETASGTDSRLSGPAFRQIPGTMFYGYSGCPLEEMLKVNGFDEICSSMGGEDYQCGMRLQIAGVKLYYSTNVMFYESEEYADQGNVFIRRDPLLSPEVYSQLLKKYNITKRYVEGRTDLSHFILDLLTRNKSWSEGNDYNLSDLRNKILQGGSFNNVFPPDLKTLEGINICEL